MTLGEALARSTQPPEIGDHEIVLDENGVAHVMIITYVDPKNHRSLGFMCPCMAFAPNTDTNALVLAKHVSCITCMSKV